MKKATADVSALKNFVNADDVSFFDNITIDGKGRKSKAINLVLPLKDKNMDLELLEVPESFYNYEVMTSDGKKLSANEEIKHYRGVVRDVKNSLVAVTFYKNEIIGLVSTDEGNFNIVKDKKSGKHLFYSERNLKQRPNFTCGTVDDGSASYDPLVLSKPRSILGWGQSGVQALAINKEVRFYVETEYDIYQDRGSISAVETFISGIFNQVAVLYQNEDISTSISCLYIWISDDPFTASTTSALLNQFQSTRVSIIGDLGILLTFRNVGGGVAAGFYGLCNASVAQRLSVAMLDKSYSTIPSYSWSVYVVTHELGHLFGSRHTHACVWNGNNTAIDGCSGYTEIGNCPMPGVPTSGGTMMSYCHWQSVGIKFNLGFGPQPGNVIRNNVTNASCLLACNSPINYTNQTVTQAVILNSCGTINAQNVNVQSGAKLGLNANQVNIKEPFTVQNGASLIINAQ